MTRPGALRRSPLIDKLVRDNSRPVVSVAAPAGYGKTTLLSQWAERNGQAFAWVSVDDKDNDPKVLLTYIAAALDAIEPVGGRVFDALTSPVSSVPGSVVPRLGTAFSSMTAPVALILDDVHVLHNSECRSALSVLADHIPDRSRLVLAGRDQPPVRVARLRAEGKILEIGPADLSFTRGEAGGLLRAAGVALDEEDLAELHSRTEGWPVGLYLAALAIRAGGSFGGAASFGGGDVFVSEYVESEFLSRISREQRRFLIRTAVLERMYGPLCEAVLERPGSGSVLAELARSNLLLVPLDHRGQWYRYHHLFRDMLLAELERREPDLIPVLRRRAAAWYLRNGMPEEALEHSIAAGDVEMGARLVEELMLPVYRQGRVTTLQRWIGWLEDRDGIGGRPLAAVWASILAARTGRPVEAERWAVAVDRWQYGKAARPDDPAVEVWAAVLRALLCRQGVQQMRTDADEAARLVGITGIVAPVVPFLQGIAQVLSGDRDGGDASFCDAVGAGDRGAPDVLAAALCERSLLAMARGDWGRTEDLAGQARAVLREARIEDSYITPLISAAQARAAWHRGDSAAARQQLAGAQRLRSVLTYAIPYLAVQARIELARVHLALADMAGARTLMREVNEILNRRPDLGTLTGEAQALRAQLSARRGPSAPGASSLTAAELRVLPLLATHLSFPEIGAALFLSPNTVKSQAMSLYRKLGATSRSQVVARCRELALLDG
ncbi:MAG TPA: LuxR C-terminal-related transcriptional regulator [Streptosporangiaceae bacterium]|nr:LuxR C-terminal-related transcriptional regulator [Streptosporangiaceae bacterium]